MYHILRHGDMYKSVDNTGLWIYLKQDDKDLEYQLVNNSWEPNTYHPGYEIVKDLNTWVKEEHFVGNVGEVFLRLVKEHGVN